MITQVEYEKILRESFAKQGVEVPQKAIRAAARKLAQPARLWAEKALGKCPLDRIKTKRKVTARLFLGIALLEDELPYSPDVEQFAYDITRGDIIGDFVELDETKLKALEVVPALLEIGNDGTYFDSDEDEEDSE
jgi:hypothetical protein